VWPRTYKIQTLTINDIASPIKFIIAHILGAVLDYINQQPTKQSLHNLNCYHNSTSTQTRPTHKHTAPLSQINLTEKLTCNWYTVLFTMRSVRNGIAPRYKVLITLIKVEALLTCCCQKSLTQQLFRWILWQLKVMNTSVD